MTQQPRSQRIVAAAGDIENAFAQLEIVQTLLNAQRERLREASAELRNVAQSLAVEGD